MANFLDKKNTVRQTRLEGVISLCKVNKTAIKNIPTIFQAFGRTRNLRQSKNDCLK